MAEKVAVAQVQHEPSRLPSPWRSVPALAERLNAGAEHPTLTDHAIRHYIRNADHNGLEPHVRRIGRKILINEPGFMDWLSGRCA